MLIRSCVQNDPGKAGEASPAGYPQGRWLP